MLQPTFVVFLQTVHLQFNYSCAAI